MAIVQNRLSGNAMLIALLFLSVFPAKAQIIDDPDMFFNLNLRSLSDSATNSTWVTQGRYYRNFYFNSPVPAWTNRFRLIIYTLETMPSSVWIMEQDNQGRYFPSMAVTNIFEDSLSTYYISQDFTLTPNQIHSLIKGKWYVAFTLEGTNYLGNLAPFYVGAKGPTAQPVVRYPFSEINYYGESWYFVLSKDNRVASVILNGASSIDKFYLPMEYLWQATTADAANRFVFTHKGMLAKRDFLIGGFEVSLQANDAIAIGQPARFHIQVITASQAVDWVRGIVDYYDVLSAPQTQALDSLLNAAKVEFDHARMSQGCYVLQEYLTLVKKFHLSKTATMDLSQYAQEIINTLNSAN